MKSPIVGICCICGQNKKMSFEHFPPKSSFNDKSIYITENAFDESSNPKLSHKGFGQYTLCERCNNDTGGWYAKAYKEWSQIGMSNILEATFNPFNNYLFNISPLNVLKQILTMFLSADKAGVLRGDLSLVKFILNKDEMLLPTKYKIFCYYTDSKLKRFYGYCCVTDFDSESKIIFNQWCEISFKPFGYILAIDSLPPNNMMTDITYFKNYKYSNKELLELQLPFLETNNEAIGDYTPFK